MFVDIYNNNNNLIVQLFSKQVLLISPNSKIQIDKRIIQARFHSEQLCVLNHVITDIYDIYMIYKQDECRRQQQRTLSCLTAVSRAPFVDILREEHAANAARPLIGLTSRGALPRAELKGGS